MADYKVHYIARTEHGYGPRRCRRWEEKEFPTKWEAEKYCEEHRKHSLNAAYVREEMEVKNVTADDIRSARTVSNYANRMFNSSKIF